MKATTKTKACASVTCDICSFREKITTNSLLEARNELHDAGWYIASAWDDFEEDEGMLTAYWDGICPSCSGGM